MGFLLSKIGWSYEPEGYDAVDPVTGLTPRQADIVRKTWSEVKKDVKGNGVELFIMFFKRFPQYQKLFKAFADVPVEKLKGNGRLLGHATSVMYAFTSVVDNLGDVACLAELLTKIAESHVPRKISARHFEHLSEVIVDFLELKLGSEVMDDAAKEAWRKTLDTMNSIIHNEMEKEIQQSV